MTAAPSLYTASTGLCADSVESVPGCHGLFALATYQVDKHEREQAQSSSSSSARPQSNDDDDEEEDAEKDTASSPAYTRRGTCSLYRASGTSNSVQCDKVDTIDTPAILDMKWSLINDDGAAKRVLGVANAKGQITLHRLQQNADAASPPRLASMGELQFNNRNALCLSLDFSDRTGGHIRGYDEANLSSDTSLIVSQSDGSLAYLPSLERALSATPAAALDDVTTSLSQTSIHKDDSEDEAEADSDDNDDWDRTSEDERLATLQAAHTTLNADFPSKPPGLTTWAAHDFEAWIAAFDCFAPTTIWSGGDDLTLKGWDLRTPITAESVPKPMFSCTKPFSGGVTSLQSHHLRQHLWAVGSYDSYLRLFDARMPARPLSETNVGGGVWRVKWHPHDPQRLLVGCMHDGFKVLQLPELGAQEPAAADLRGKEFDVVTRFDEHESLAYGCDWDRGAEDDRSAQGKRVYSCSFYDATLHVWDSL